MPVNVYHLGDQFRSNERVGHRPAPLALGLKRSQRTMNRSLWQVLGSGLILQTYERNPCGSAATAIAAKHRPFMLAKSALDRSAPDGIPSLALA